MIATSMRLIQATFAQMSHSAGSIVLNPTVRRDAACGHGGGVWSDRRRLLARIQRIVL